VSLYYINAYKVFPIQKIMDEKLYLARGSVYIEARAHHPEESGATNFSEYKLILAEDSEKATEKLLSNLRQNSRYGDWKCSDIKELNSGKDVKLEKRVEILGEIFSILK
jgi:hypothetical protein